MRVLLLNQTFHPDRVSSGQHLTDLALALVAEGHAVTVLTSARGYDDPSVAFPAHERWRGIDIVRIRSVALGKTARWRRAVEFGSYAVQCAFRLARFPRVDVVVALTSPPLISVLGALFTRVKGGRFVFWVMDLNPDEAVAAGWLKRDSIAAKVLGGLLRFSLRTADAIVALDRFMADIITAKGIAPDRITVLPPWAIESVSFDQSGRQAFRDRHGWTDRFVVMYAGNHSPCNPLDTVLAAAERLRDTPDLLFCFMGGGSEFRRIEQVAADRRLQNVVCLGYQPREKLAGALSAADLHVVTFGDDFRGLIHPCKIYNVLKVGAPVLYVGPQPSHVTEVIETSGGRIPAWVARHGDVDAVTRAVIDARARSVDMSRVPAVAAAAAFDAPRLVPALVRLVVTAESTTREPALKRV